MCGGTFMETCGYMWGQTLHVGSNTKKKTLKQRFKVFFFGGRYRTRTCDLLHVKQMLYQLS